MSKPATLQINCAGAWRNVCEFDMADNAAMSHVMGAAVALATHGLNQPKVRIVKLEGGYATPLMRWCADSGWRSHSPHAQQEEDHHEKL